MKCFPVTSVSINPPGDFHTPLSRSLSLVASENNGRLAIMANQIVAITGDNVNNSSYGVIVIIDGTQVMGTIGDPVEV